MDKFLYQDIILRNFYPFMAAKYDLNCILHQDNDPKHLSKVCTDALAENGIKWVKIFFILKFN